MNVFKYKVFLASDHAGLQLKNILVDWLEGRKMFNISDLGCQIETDTVDYPDYALNLVRAMEPGLNHSGHECKEFGILVCKSGCGMCIAANRHSRIRASVCTTVEMAVLARKHNNINILCLGQDFINQENAKKAIDAFFDTSFLGGKYAKRLSKIDTY